MDAMKSNTCFAFLLIVLCSGIAKGFHPESYRSNLALKKPASMSSSPDSSWSANTGNNGCHYLYLEIRRSCCFMTRHTFEPWWQVDLEQVYLIKRVDTMSAAHVIWDSNARQKRLIVYGMDNLEVKTAMYAYRNKPAWTVAAYNAERVEGRVFSFTIDSILARYVRITRKVTTGALMLCEVEVYGTKYANLALRKPATASSQYFEYFGPEKGNEGSAYSNRYINFYCCITETEFEPWWKVDLQGVYYIAKVRVVLGNIYTNIEIAGSIDNKTWTVLVHKEGNVVQDVQLTVNRKARYVRVQLRDVTTRMKACEIEVYGEDINECYTYTDRCHAKATCTNTIGSHTCACNKGYSGNGVSCTDINECATNADNCHADATCTNKWGSFNCACNMGYSGTGRSCLDINECSTNTTNCHAKATCTNTKGSHTCACNNGYSGNGVSCEDINECDTNAHNCHADATCTNKMGSFDCVCNTGYSGTGLSCLDINECSTNTDNCHAEATCTNTKGSHTCACNTGYSRNGVSCEDINECEANTDNCHANATCTNTVGSYTCACNTGYSGDGESCAEINECTTNADNCHANATCTNNVGSFDCACNTGYSGTGVECSDINECEANTDTCHANATCTNTVGSYTCACNTGFSGDGESCADINECKTNADNCHANATCTNNVGSFDCTCNTGYSGTGVVCSDINECTTNTHNCHSDGTCTNNKGSYTCACNTGYSGNGYSCSDIDECDVGTDNCDENATCTNNKGSFACSCNSGYSGDGVTCTDNDECTDKTHDCHWGALCTNTPGSFFCTCDKSNGYFGEGTTCSRVMCYPNNTIDVYGLPANSHYFAIQNTTVTIVSGVKCTVSDLNSTAVTITGCTKDLPILLTYGSYSGMEQHGIHGGKSMHSVIIKCNEIPSAGNDHFIDNTLSASMIVDQTADVIPTYDVTSYLDTSSTTVGSNVEWTISFPPEYILEVSSCTAYPGTSASDTSVSLVNIGGCYVNDELITHFTDNMDGTATATILAFKFYTSDDVYLTCDLKICPSGPPQSCDTTCSRQKRSYKHARSLSGNGVNQTYTAMVHNVLRVVDQLSASAPSLAHGFHLYILLILAVVYRFVMYQHNGKDI